MFNLKQAICVAIILFGLPALLAAQDATQEATAEATIQPSWTVFASGLNSPRGLKFAPDGNLYVAESGEGGTTLNTTSADCDQVVAPVGPYTAGDPTARISRIDSKGNRTTAADKLPSSQTSAGSGGLVTGVTDIAFIGDTLYALVGGAGCSHGLKDTPNGVYQVNTDGSTKLLADLSAFWKANPVKNTQPADFEPDGTPYSLIAVDGNLYVIEPNHGELDKVTPKGAISRVIDISANAGHIVPTSATYYNGHFYIGNLSIFPVTVGAAGITEVSPDGKYLKQTLGLAMVTGVAFDQQGRLYALESSTADKTDPTPGTGKVVRFDLTTGTTEDIATGLSLPTAMTFGPDGALYVSNFGFGFPPGTGEIERIEIPA